MINSLQEIHERFDKIKDHKPKATKKLNELGDILASAFKFDPHLANEMWQYLVQLNVSDTPENAKFYIAQVFNKLTDRISPEDASSLLAMVPERVELMILYGYDGNSMWHCLDVLIRGFLKLDSVDNCMAVIEYYFAKINKTRDISGPSIAVVANAIRAADELYRNEPQYEFAVHSLMHQLLDVDDDRINAYVRILLITLGYEDCADPDELITLALEYKFASEFIDLMWKNRSSMTAEEFAARWIEYLEDLDEDDSQIPRLTFEEDRTFDDGNYDDSNRYEGSKMQFFVSMMKDNDNILPYYFNNASDIADYIIYSWISDGDWERFSRYTAQMLLNTHEQTYEYSRVKRLLDCYLDAYFYEDYHDSTDEYGRSNKLITKGNLVEVEKALANISAMTVGCPLHDEFHESIKEFMQRASGNLDALNDVGFAEVVDERTTEQRLKDYIHEFLQSGEREHNGTRGEYRRICDAISDEVHALYENSPEQRITIDISGLIKKKLFERMVREGTVSEKDRASFLGDSSPNAEIVTSQEDEHTKVDHNLEREYLHALDDEIVEFYFLHCKHEADKKAKMIAACIKKEYVPRAIELVELLLKTSKYEDFFAHNSWAFEMKRVADILAMEFTREGRFSWRNEDVTDDQVQTTYQLIDKLIPHLDKDDVESVRTALMKMMPEKADNDAYIHSLMEDVVVYTTFPKPRGKGSAMNINRMSSKIMGSFEILSQMKRLDVISEILTKFAAVKDILAPVVYSTWMHSVARSIPSEDFCEVYRMNKPAFWAWLEMDLRVHDIINVAEKLGEGCEHSEFLEFRSRVISRYGLVDGLDACFQFTSENTETLLLCDSDTIQLKLDYLETNYSCADLHLLVSPKNKQVDSIRIVNCKINGITVESEDLGACRDFDDCGPTHGFYVYGWNEDKALLTIYSGFFEKNTAKDVKRIELKISVYDGEGNQIEEISEIVIAYDNDQCVYVVLQQGYNIQTMIPFEPAAIGGQDIVDEDEVDEDPSDDSFEDITFYDENDIRIDFCGLDFNGDTLNLNFWVDNEDSEDRKFFAKQLKINGVLVEEFDLIGEIESSDCGYLELELDDFEDTDYEDINTIEFSVEINDEHNNGLFDTRCIYISCDTQKEIFSVLDSKSSLGADAGNETDADKEFEDVEFYDDNDIRIEFCGIEFNGDSLVLKFWVDSDSEEDRNLWAKQIRINGTFVAAFEEIGTISNNDCEFLEMELDDFGDIDYHAVTSIEFSVEIDDEYDDCLFETPHLLVSCDTNAETCAVEISQEVELPDITSDESDEADSNDGCDSEEFEDITFYNTNSLRIDFCGLEFENETLSIKFWVSNHRDEIIKLFAKDLTINDTHKMSFAHFVTVQPHAFGYCKFVVSEDYGEDYYDITHIDFSVEIDDSECNDMYVTPELHIACDVEDEQFSVNIPGVGSYGADVRQAADGVSSALRELRENLEALRQLLESFDDE